jgi:hypothetical protein
MLVSTTVRFIEDNETEGDYRAAVAIPAGAALI